MTKLNLSSWPSRRQLLLEALLVVFFVFALSTPTLIKTDVPVAPLLIKTLIVCSLSFFVNLHLLMPKVLFEGRYKAYIGWLAALTVFELFLMKILGSWNGFDTFPAPFKPNWYLPFEWMLHVAAMFFVSTIFGYYVRERHTKEREMDLRHQNIEFEMKFLKSQINPHFLFNALNNIYALSVIKSDKASEMVLKLSDMLRFTLYESEKPKVKLRREVEYIMNFIDFQRLKADSDLNISVDASNFNHEFMIEPMLLIPFIENSFKHGNISNSKKGWLQVEIKTLGPILFFKVRNSLPSIAINKDVVGGIGVENVRRRLDILYGDRCEMEIASTDTEFSVSLKIDTISA